MIILVGVGHVFDISEQVRQIIIEHTPVAIGLELDRNRFHVLLARDRGEELPKRGGALARFQERIAKDFGEEWVAEHPLIVVQADKIPGVIEVGAGQIRHAEEEKQDRGDEEKDRDQDRGWAHKAPSA